MAVHGSVTFPNTAQLKERVTDGEIEVARRSSSLWATVTSGLQPHSFLTSNVTLRWLHDYSQRCKCWLPDDNLRYHTTYWHSVVTGE